MYRYKNVFTTKEYDVIEWNLKAFVVNFGYPVIEKGELEGWYVSINKDSSPLAYCHDITYLDGWLWGCVQGANHRLPMRRKYLNIKWLDGGTYDVEEVEEV